jgi:hypothetical protein
MLTNLPFLLPAWMPGWAFLLLAVPVLLYCLAFLLMPFSVFGVKSRIESLEAQIDALHEDVRMMAMRSSGVLPPAATTLDPYDDVPNFGRIKKSQRGFAEPAMTAAPSRLPPVPEPIIPVRNPAPTPHTLRRREPRLD